jgi:hypothetical protein
MSRYSGILGGSQSPREMTPQPRIPPYLLIHSLYLIYKFWPDDEISTSATIYLVSWIFATF